MKKVLIPTAISFLAVTLLSGCVVAFTLGGGKKDSSTSTTSTTSDNQRPVVSQQTIPPTIGQQLIDLKKARDAGAISESEYEAEKAKILNEK